MAVTLEAFSAFPVIHGISDRRISHVDFLEVLGVPAKSVARLEQVHGGKVADVDRKTGLGKEILGADAAVTGVKAVALSVRTADCLPVFFYDPERHIAGIAHAGWRSTKEKIVKNVVEAMKAYHKSDPAKIIIGFGPALRQCCYEVKIEFAGYFPDSVTRTANRHYFDIVNENSGQLMEAGVSAKNMYDCGICTSCSNADFFSFRKERDRAGRMLSVIMLK